MDFFDLSVHAIQDGKLYDDFFRMAKHLNFRGIGVSHSDGTTLTEYNHQIDNFEIFHTIEINATNPAKLYGLIQKNRMQADVVIVRGGNEHINRAAVENANVDVLIQPMIPNGSGLNHILAKSASKNNVAIGFDIRSLIMTRGGSRIHNLSHFRTNLMLARKYDVPMLLVSDALSAFELRAPREMMALASLFGMTKEEALIALSHNPAHIIKRNRHREQSICEGVSILDDTMDLQEDM